MWVTMQEAVPVMRALQNHLPVFTHFTTLDGLYIPQYLPRPRKNLVLCAHGWYARTTATDTKNTQGGGAAQAECGRQRGRLKC